MKMVYADSPSRFFKDQHFAITDAIWQMNMAKSWKKN